MGISDPGTPKGTRTPDLLVRSAERAVNYRIIYSDLFRFFPALYLNSKHFVLHHLGPFCIV